MGRGNVAATTSPRIRRDGAWLMLFLAGDQPDGVQLGLNCHKKDQEKKKEALGGG